MGAALGVRTGLATAGTGLASPAGGGALIGLGAHGGPVSTTGSGGGLGREPLTLGDPGTLGIRCLRLLRRVRLLATCTR